MIDPNRELMSKIIRKTVRKFRKHPWDINCGLCGEFADEVEKQVPRAYAYELGTEDTVLFWSHVCIKFEGYFYDAEEPYGVKHWRQLPLCVRARRKE
jgi:hypothetical protein